MERGALTSLAFWTKAGTWVQSARAEYLVAMTMNRIDKPGEARSHALCGIATIEAGGKQEVDLAFLALELAHAEARLGNAAAASAARRRSEALAANFADDSLREWYSETVAKLDALGEPHAAE